MAYKEYMGRRFKPNNLHVYDSETGESKYLSSHDEYEVFDYEAADPSVGILSSGFLIAPVGDKDEDHYYVVDEYDMIKAIDPERIAAIDEMERLEDERRMKDQYEYESDDYS